MFKYRHLNPQPISVYFTLKGIYSNEKYLSALEKAGELNPQKRPVIVKIRVNQTWYGPYKTNLRASPHDFIYRNMLYPNKEQMELRRKIKQWDNRIVEAWGKLLPAGETITGGMIVAQLKYDRFAPNLKMYIRPGYDAL